MKSSIRRNYAQAFIVDDVSLRQLAQLSDSFEPTYVVKSKNGMALECSSIDELLSLSNPSSNPINEISVRGYSAENGFLFVTLDNSGLSYNIMSDKLNLSQTVSKQLDEWAREVRTWYSAIATADFIIVVFSLLLSFITLVSAFYLFYVVRGEYTPNPSETNSATSNAILNLLFPGLLIIGFGLNKVRSLLFPIQIFAIGHGKKRLKKLERWRTFLGSTILLAVIINIISSLIFAGIWTP